MCDPESSETNSKPAASADSGESVTVLPVPRWAIHRRLYDWMLSFAHRKHSSTALFAFSFAESSFFPIPPDVLLLPLCIGKREKAVRFATICTVASVLGAFLGYLIGYAAIDLAVKIPGIEMGSEVDPQRGTVNWLAAEFDERGVWYVFIAALTPIPFKLLTITSGFAQMNLFVFAIACIVGRATRFFAVALVCYFVGPRAVPLIDKYFNLLSIAFVVLLVLGFAVLKFI